MKKFLFTLLFLLSGTLFFCPGGAALFAQNNNNILNDNNHRTKPLYETKTDSVIGPVDTLSKRKKFKPKKPFNSYLFADSLKKQNIYSWNIDLSNATIKMIAVDSSLTDFQKNYVFLKNTKTGAAYLGGLGAASAPLDYSLRTNLYANSFTNAMGDYFFTPQNVSFYNGKTPFSQFEYITSGQRQYAEEHLFVNHAQNISPATSMDLTYRNNRTRGIYQNQQSINKNLSINLAHTGQRYTLFTGYINNIADLQENGGVRHLGDILDTTITQTKNIAVNLKQAKNVIRGNQFYLTQSYAIGLKGEKIDSATNMGYVPYLAIGMALNYSSYRKIYTDRRDENSAAYYPDWFFNTNQSRDSISEKNLDLKFFTRYQPYNKYGIIGNVTAGVGYEKERYYNFKPEGYIDPEGGVVNRNNFYLYGDIDGGYFQYLRWKADVKYYLLGYRSQNIDAGGSVNLFFGKTKNPILMDMGVRVSNSSPSYWSEHYWSNHFMWDNNFKNEFKLKYEFNFRMPAIGLHLGFKEIVEKNKVYYNEFSLPAQSASAVSLTSIYAQKDFKWKGFNFKHRMQLQFSSDQTVIPVPLFSANFIYYYDIIVVKNVLNIHLGLDAYYNTSYYGPGYNPAVGQFYNQRTYKTGNYPWVDLFAVGKWKRVRLILKLQHANFDLFGGRNYMSVASYPMNRRMFTFGFSWSFYD